MTVKLPQGVKDSLVQESYNLNEIKKVLREKFLLSGFNFVQSAGLEYYDTYANIKSSISQSKMFKMTDKDGNLIVLRPDTTLAVARIAATKMKEETAKLCYFSNAYDFSASGNSYREVNQAGVEILGQNGAFADAQVIAFAIECLLSVGLKDFIIDVGHVGFFKGLLQDSGLSNEEIEELRAYVNAKDSINTQLCLKKYNAGERAKRAIMAIPTLFGGVEILTEAEKLTENKIALSALSELKEIYNFLCCLGYEKFVSFDLGTVKSLDYYSGVVFTGLAKGVGASLLSGGRYDNLTAEFGRKISAVGFAIGLKRTLTALESVNGIINIPQTQVVIVCEKGGEIVGYNAYKKYIAEGKSCNLIADSNVKVEKGEGEYYIATKNGLVKL